MVKHIDNMRGEHKQTNTEACHRHVTSQLNSHRVCHLVIVSVSQQVSQSQSDKSSSHRISIVRHVYTQSSSNRVSHSQLGSHIVRDSVTQQKQVRREHRVKLLRFIQMLRSEELFSWTPLSLCSIWIPLFPAVTSGKTQNRQSTTKQKECNMRGEHKHTAWKTI